MERKKILILSGGFAIFLALMFFSVMFLINQCSTNFEYREVERVNSPDGLYDTVYALELAGGALGSVVHQIYLVKSNHAFLKGKLIFEGVHIDSLDVFWQNDSSIVLSRKKNNGRIIMIKDSVLIKNSQGESKEISLNLKVFED